MKDLLTILVTTSPIPIHPSTEVIDQVLTSLELFPDLASCTRLILCDGIRESKENKYKQGQVTEDRKDAYEGYKKNLQTKYGAEDHYRIVEMKQHATFIGLLREGLTLVTTPYVLILQHDYIFTENTIPFSSIVESMVEGQLNYVGFTAKTNFNYLLRAQSCFKLQKEPRLCVKPIKGVPLCPLFFWYDKNHLASADYYRTVILQQLKDGFIEDQFGQTQRQAITEQGFDAFDAYKSYLYYPTPLTIVVRHIHGRRFGTGKKYRPQKIADS